jgi:hypothetical protein
MAAWRDLESLGSVAAREVVRALPQFNQLVQDLALKCHKLGGSNPWLVDLVREASPESVDCLIRMLKDPVRSATDAPEGLLLAMFDLDPENFRSKQLCLRLALGLAPWVFGAGSYVWFALAREVVPLLGRFMSHDGAHDVDRSEEQMLALLALNVLRDKLQTAVSQRVSEFDDVRRGAQALVERIDQELLKILPDLDQKDKMYGPARMTLAGQRLA